MTRNPQHRASPRVEPLEGRCVLSAVATLPRPTVAIRLNLSDGTGLEAVLYALRGGPGSEFLRVVRRQVNINRTILEFASGQRKELIVKGVAIKTPKLAPAYTGPQLDQFNPTAAGALLLPRGRIELGAILRGPIDRPETVTYVWGLDRGGGTVRDDGFGPAGTAYDAYVSVTRSGGAVAASITDLKTGAVTPLDPSVVKIQGPAIRVFLPRAATLLPPNGAPLAQYRFSFWTRSGPGGASDLAGFLPSAGTVPVARA